MWYELAMLRLCAASLIVLAGLAACKGDERSPSAPPPPPTTAVSVDAGVATVALDAGNRTLPTHNPTGLYAEDEIPATRPVARVGSRDRRVVQLLLRSSPSGATAAVDGVRLGATPVLWEGELTGLTREVTFVLAGHALARYRFVPVTSGIVHGTLAKVADDGSVVAPALVPIPPPELPARRSSPPPAAPPIDAAPAATPLDAALPPPLEPAADVAPAPVVTPDAPPS